MLPIRCGVIGLLLGLLSLQAEDPFADVTRGALRAQGPDGVTTECPLLHSAYTVEIAGPVAQVTLVQTFANPFPGPVEAVYVFPLPHEAGVNGLTMEIGERRIVGALLRREDARVVYEEATKAGKTASLLDQERPNIFTQRVGNLPPGEEVRIRIAYVERLVYDRGAYECHLPLVVGPRFIPGSPISGTAPPDPAVAAVAIPVQVDKGDGAPKGSGWSPDTNQVPDASRITPPVLRPGQRPAHQVSIAVRLAAGLAITDLRSVHHRVTIARPTPATAEVVLHPDDALPNKDFVLRYAIDGERPVVGALAHQAADGGYVLLTLQPGRLDQHLDQRVPRDLCFLVDVSGSMHGKPLEQVKAAMRVFLGLAGPQDRIQVITFAGAAHTCFGTYLPATPENTRLALRAVDDLQSGGGTTMLAGIEAVLQEPPDPARQRMVVMLTDGYIGNEREIIAALGGRLTDRQRFWCLGIGTSVNRFLVDGVAAVGGGMGQVLGLDEDALSVVGAMMARIQRPQLEAVHIDWGGLPVSEVVPQGIPSLWSGQPLQITARYDATAAAASATVTVHGRCAGEQVSIPVTVSLAEARAGTSAVRSVWARQRSAELQRQELRAHDDGLVQAITDLSLRYSLMGPYTSFVAVDERILAPTGPARRIDVAVPLPAGVGEQALPVLPKQAIEGAVGELAGAIRPAGSTEQGSTGAFMAIGGGGGSAGMFGSRSGGGKRRALAKGGGTRASESAVDLALKFLARHQGADGSWHPVSYPANCSEAQKCEPGQGGVEEQVSLTAQIAVGFLMAGYDHQTPNKHRPSLQKAIGFLLAQQRADGALAADGEAHAQALDALGQALAMTGDPTLVQPIQRALEHLLALRLPGPDGRPLAWGAEGIVGTRVTVAAVMALKSCAVAGRAVGDGLESAERWHLLAWRSANPTWSTLHGTEASRFPSYWSPAAGPVGEDTASGAALSSMLGLRRGDVALDSLMVRLLVQHPGAESLRGDPRQLWLATRACYGYGGGAWSSWNPTMLALLTASQRRGDGCHDGSWDPPAANAPASGRLQSTVHALWTQELYYAFKAAGSP
jgi:Ca-activated chloride channel family protein